MKLKKILAAVAAAALAVSAMAINAFASEPVKGAPGYKPGPLFGSNITIPDSIYGAGVEVTFNISVNDINYGWNNGSAGIFAGDEYVTEVKYGGTSCDAEANRSWFPEGSVVIGDDQKTASIVCKADLTGKSGFNVFIYSSESDNGAFNLESITIKNAAGFEAKYADGKLDITGGNDAAPADETAAADKATDDKTAEADSADVADDEADADIVDTDDDDDAAGDTAADNAAPATTEAVAPAADTTTAAAATGNVAVASIAAVMAVAGAVAIVSKKRK